MIAIVFPELRPLSYDVLQFRSVQMYLFTHVKEWSDDTLSMGKSVIALMFRFSLYFSAGNTIINFGRNQPFFIQLSKCRQIVTVDLIVWQVDGSGGSTIWKTNGFLSMMFSLALLNLHPAYRILSQFITELSFRVQHLLMTRFSCRALISSWKVSCWAFCFISFSVPL